MYEAIGTVLRKAAGFFSRNSAPTRAAADRRRAARVADDATLIAIAGLLALSFLA